jgi:GcrA cell cycle regulator
MNDLYGKLRELLKTPASYGEIGRQLGISRNAVSGMVWRMRKNEAIDRPLPAKKVRLVKQEPRIPAPKATRERLKPHIKQMQAEVQPRKGITLMQLNADTCRFSIGETEAGEYVFCGAPPKTGRPYCEHHCKIAYVPSKFKEKKAEKEPFRFNF